MKQLLKKSHLKQSVCSKAIKSKEESLDRVEEVYQKNWELYLLLVPVILYFLIFHYYPLYGLQIAFKDFIATKGISGSPWVGFKHFERFFDSYYFGRLIKNTIGIGVFTLLVSFPVPIIIALLLNEVKSLRFKKFVQTIIYAPHFYQQWSLSVCCYFS